MKMTREQFKNIVKEVLSEEAEYQEFFKRALEKTGKSIPDMSDEEKKAFFNKIDAAWQGKGEKNEDLVGNQHKLDIDGDGEIEASDLAALRAGKKVNEIIKTYKPGDGEEVAKIYSGHLKGDERYSHALTVVDILHANGLVTKPVAKKMEQELANSLARLRRAKELK